MERGPSYQYVPDQGSMDEKSRVLAVLERHAGAKNAITSRELERELGMPARKVRAIIAGLVDQGALIGASVEGLEGGYYLITTFEELEITRAVLRSRAQRIFARDKALSRAWERAHGCILQPLLPLPELAP